MIFHVDCVFYDRNKSNTSHTSGRSESGQEDDFEPAGFCTMDSKSTTHERTVTVNCLKWCGTVRVVTVVEANNQLCQQIIQPSTT